MANDTNKPPDGATVEGISPKAHKAPTVFSREELVHSNKFSQYHPDMLRALLPKENYTMADAERIVDGYFSKGGK